MPKPFLILCVLMLAPVSAKVLAENSPLSIMSWNVWFDDKSGPKRYPNILREIESAAPEVVFLQEVTPNFLAHVRKLGSYYLITSTDAKRSYGQAFLSKKRMLLSKEYTLPSDLGRDVLFGLYKLNPDTAVVLINVHLESGRYESDTRTEQVRLIKESLLQQFHEDANIAYPKLTIAGTIWAGDFNMSEEVKGFTDLALQANDHTFTYAPDNNRLASESSGWFARASRLDRILLSEDSNLRLQSFEVLNAPRFNGYSDHYPLKASLTWER